MKVAVLGTGFGSVHAQKYCKFLPSQNIFVWGRNKEKLQNLKDSLGINTVTNFDDIWNNDSIDLVDICLPNSLHKEIAIKAMKSGKHVYIETPIAETQEDANAILEVAKETGKKAFVDLFMRFEYAYDFVFKKMQEGNLGQLKALYVKRDTPPWWGNLDLSEIGIQLMIHDVDFICRMMGEPDEIKTSSVSVRENESIISALMQYENSYAVLSSSSAMPGAHPFTIGYEAIFEKGTIRYTEDGYEENRKDAKLSMFTDKERLVFPLESVDCWEHAIKHVLDCCEKNISIINPAEGAALALKTVLRMNAAIRK